MTGRRDLAQRFLEAAGWGAARRVPLAGDASDRRYERVFLAGQSAVLMDAPPGSGDDPRDFLKIGRHLNGLGLSAPRCLAEDLAQGFLLLEDLGDGLYSRLIAAGQPELPLYIAAAEVLLHLQSAPAPAGLPDLTAADWASAAMFAVTWYRRAITGDEADPTPLQTELTHLLAAHADAPRVLILRDYHAENLLWLPERVGVARVGLLDFQLGQMGQPDYDLISLLQDARRDVSHETFRQVLRHVARLTGREEAQANLSCAVLGVQRALRILGIFARLCLVAGKPGYLPLLPRVWAQLTANLAHPRMNRLAGLCETLLPPPTETNLSRIAHQCGHFR